MITGLFVIAIVVWMWLGVDLIKVVIFALMFFCAVILCTIVMSLIKDLLKPFHRGILRVLKDRKEQSSLSSLALSVLQVLGLGR